MRRALFMDRDGTVSPEVGFLDDVERVELLPRSAEAIRLATQSGFVTVLVTNQSGVARGFFSEARLDAFRKLIRTRSVLPYYLRFYPDSKHRA